MMDVEVLGITEAVIVGAERWRGVGVTVITAIVVFKVALALLRATTQAVIAAILVGGLALWGSTAGMDWVAGQAEREADAIVNSDATPTITLPGN